MFKYSEAKLDTRSPTKTSGNPQCVCVEVATRENGGAVNPFHVMQVLEHNLMDKCLEAKLDTESEEPNQNFRQSSACVEVAQSIAWQHDYF